MRSDSFRQRIPAQGAPELGDAVAIFAQGLRRSEQAGDVLVLSRQRNMSAPPYNQHY